MKWSNQRRSISKFNNNKELLEAAIYRYTSKRKLKQNSWKLTAREFIPQQSWRPQACNYTENEIHHSLFQRPRHQVWNCQLQYGYLYYCHKTEHFLLDGCFCCWNLHSRKSTTRKSTFGSSPQDLKKDSWKMLAKEPTLLQSCRLAVLKMSPVIVILHRFCQDPE